MMVRPKSRIAVWLARPLPTLPIKAHISAADEDPNRANTAKYGHHSAKRSRSPALLSVLSPKSNFAIVPPATIHYSYHHRGMESCYIYPKIALERCINRTRDGSSSYAVIRKATSVFHLYGIQRGTYFQLLPHRENLSAFDYVVAALEDVISINLAKPNAWGGKA